MIEAFDNFAIENRFTRRISFINAGPEDTMLTFRDSKHKVTQNSAQHKVNDFLKHRANKVDKADMCMISVTMKMYQLRWLLRDGGTFLDFVEILNMNDNLQVL